MDKPSQFTAFLFPGSRSEQETCWRPPVDIYRVPDGWVLKFDLAGVKLEDVDVQVEGCRITVRGVRRDWLAEEMVGCSYYSMEIAYSRFERTVDLPCNFDDPKVTAEGRDGILVIRVTEGAK